MSHITILRPRDPNYGTSSRLTTDFLLQLETTIDRDKWENRKEFLYQTLAFCLSLPNLWRFPKEAFTQGQGAFVWIYILLMISMGSALLFFEVALGQYSCKGFAKVFSMCPLFEGISYSMAFYCTIVSIYYNMLNAYSFIYIFASFNKTLEYSSCANFPQVPCQNVSLNQSLSPEKVFFNHRIIYYSTDDFDEVATSNKLNLRNIGILFFLWILICIVILRGIRTAKWPAMVYCPIPFIVLTLTLISALTLKGSTAGIKAMFTMHAHDFFNIRIWRYALEQTIVALGLGMGPLITLGSYSKFQSPADRDCFVLCICTLIGSLLSGSVFFATLGALAHERNQTMSTVLNGKHPYGDLDVSTHVIFSQLFTRLHGGVSHVGSFLFFLTFLLAGWYSLITYTETFIVSCYTFFPSSLKHKVITNLGLCLGCYIFGCTMASRTGYNIMMLLDRYLVASGLAAIILFELCAVIYIYGVHDFCDDIDFMLGFYPNMYYQFVWICTPVIFLGLLTQFFYAVSTEITTRAERFTILGSGVVLILPIICVAIYNSYVSVKSGGFQTVFSPREVPIHMGVDDDDTSFYGKPGPSRVFKEIIPNT